MKRLSGCVWLLLICLFAAACSPSAGEANEGQTENLAPSAGNTYENEAFGYAVELPEKIVQSCEIEESEDGTEVYFSLKDGGDMVMMIRTVTDEEFQPSLGSQKLGSKDGLTTYMQLPTCGTLNNEKARDQWDKLVKEAGKISEKDWRALEPNGKDNGI